MVRFKTYRTRDVFMTTRRVNGRRAGAEKLFRDLNRQEYRRQYTPYSNQMIDIVNFASHRSTRDMVG